MKITKRQLRRIIKEEKARLVREQRHSEMSMHATATPGFDGSLMDEVDHGVLDMKIESVIRQFVSMGYTREDVIYAIKGIIE